MKSFRTKRQYLLWNITVNSAALNFRKVEYDYDSFSFYMTSIAISPTLYNIEKLQGPVYLLHHISLLVQ